MLIINGCVGYMPGRANHYVNSCIGNMPDHANHYVNGCIGSMLDCAHNDLNDVNDSYWAPSPTCIDPSPHGFA